MYVTMAVSRHVTRTTVRLPPELLAAAQQRARDSVRTFTELLADSLRNEPHEPAAPARVCEPPPTYRGNRIRPGDDLADGAALHDLMDGL